MDTTETWQALSCFRSPSYTRKYLFRIYEKEGRKDARTISYRNCTPFIHYLEHGKNYYDLARQSPVTICPVLLFYGMCQLIKACLLTHDADYPQTTAVLAHGVSTRKRKKAGFCFLEDEVLLQKNGLARHFARKLFHVGPLDGQKWKMEALMERIPEMAPLFLTLQGKKLFEPVEINGLSLSVSDTVLDDLHVTFRHFCARMKNHSPLSFSRLLHKDGRIVFTLPAPLPPFAGWPFAATVSGKLFLPKKKKNWGFLPEMLVHFLLLYNLSMISRYETDWWCELFHLHASDDLPYIEQFLQVTQEKIPRLAAVHLLEQA